MTRLLAIYPLAMAAALVVLPVLAPRSGPLALLLILSVHLALAAIVLVPVAIVQRDAVLRWSVLALAMVVVIRFGGEWFSLSPTVDASHSLFRTASWNLELGARNGEQVVDGLGDLQADVIALQELGPEHAQAISASTGLIDRFPARALYPDAGVLGIGLLSRGPIVRVDRDVDPSVIEAVIDVDGHLVTVITAHPLPGRISMVGPIPLGFDGTARDAAIRKVRSRVDSAITRGETVILLGDFNVTPTEPGYLELANGLMDAHAEAGQGTGWTWRPSRLEWTGLGFLRIDVAMSGPGASPISTDEQCRLPGDHCQLEATFTLGPRTVESARVVLRGNDAVDPFPISVLDQTGLLVGATADFGTAGFDGAHVVPDVENRIRLQWVGGACEIGTRVVLSRRGTGMLMTVDRIPREKIDGGCILIGYVRSIDIDFAQPVDPAQITVIVDGLTIDPAR